MKTRALSIVVLIVTLFLASCQKEDYLSAIPDNAECVVSIDFKTLANDADLANSGVMALVNKSLGLVVKEQDIDKVKEYINAPEKIGIDFRSPVYIFSRISNNAFSGATMKVHSESDLESFLKVLSEQNLCSKPVKKDGRLTGKIMDDVEYSFDGSSLILLVAKNNSTTNVMKQLVGQTVDESFVSTVDYDRLSDSKGTIKVYVTSEFVTKIYDSEISDIKAITSFDFDKGKASVHLAAWGGTAKSQKLIDEMYANMKHLNGEFDDDMPADFISWASVGVNGEWLLGKLKENKDTKELLFTLERAIDIEQMLRAVDGDVTYVLLPPTNDSNMPASSQQNFIFNAQLKHAGFMKDVDYWTQSMADYGMSMQHLSADNYLLNAGDIKLHWGLDDDRDELYFATPDAYDSMKYARDNDILHDYEDDIEHSYSFVYFNMENVAKMLGKSAPFLSRYTSKLSQIKAFIIKSQKVGEVEVDIEMSDKNTNFLKQVLGWTE